MTTAIETTTESFPHAVLGRGYSSRELALIKDIWNDTKQVAQQKMQLCVHLYELKQEMDANDPNAGAGGNGTKSRFWAAFEQGDLPEYVASKRQRAEEWLMAAEFAASGSFPGASGNALLALTPSTVCNLARIDNPKAKAIAEQHLQVHEFIGHDAASYLCKNNLDDEVLDELSAWIKEYDTKVLVPSVIRKVVADVETSRRPASTQTVDIAETPDDFNDLMESIRKAAPERERQARIEVVKEELSRPERERHQQLEDKVMKYSQKLSNAHTAIHDLLIFLQGIDRIQGTQYLEEMRRADVRGLVTVTDDLSRIKKLGEELMTLARLANSCNPPTGIDMTTYTVDAE